MQKLKRPPVSYSQMNIHMPDALRAYVLMVAEEQHKSQSQVILDLIRKDIEARKNEEQRQVLISRFLASKNVKAVVTALSPEEKAHLIKEIGI